LIILNENGYLPPGMRELTLEQIQEYFVLAFQTSKTRNNIFNGYKAFCQFLYDCGVVEYTHWLDGSFFTSKVDPNDIDCVTIVQAELLNSLSPTQRSMLQQLTIPGFVKSKYLCDAFWCCQSLTNDPRITSNPLNGVNGKMYWRGVFGFDRINVPKGIIVREVKEGS
jgi:hypothetical protein